MIPRAPDNQPAAPSPSIVPWLPIGHRWPGVGDPDRSAMRPAIAVLVACVLCDRINAWPNRAAAVTAPIALRFQIGPRWRRVPDQRRSV